MECTSSENHCDVGVKDPVYIEIIVNEREPARSSICKLFDKCSHLKTDEWISEFRQLHPECF